MTRYLDFELDPEPIKDDMSLVYHARRGGEEVFLKIYRFDRSDPRDAHGAHNYNKEIIDLLMGLGNVTEKFLQHGVGPEPSGDTSYKPEAYFQAKPWIQCRNLQDYFIEQDERINVLLGKGDPASLAHLAALLDQRRHVVAILFGILALCHGKGLVHQDLKPAQIILVPASPGPIEGKFRPVITDFDGAFFEGQKEWVRLFTPGWESYEQAQEKGCCRGSDVFTMGRILFEALGLGRQPFHTMEEQGDGLTLAQAIAFTRRCRYCWSLWDIYGQHDLSPYLDRNKVEAVDQLLKACFAKEASARPTAQDAAARLLKLSMLKAAAPELPAGALGDLWFRLRGAEAFFTIREEAPGRPAFLDRQLAKVHFSELADDAGNAMYKYFAKEQPCLLFRRADGDGWQVKLAEGMPNGFTLRRRGAADLSLGSAWVSLREDDRLILFSTRQKRLLEDCALSCARS